MMVNYAEFLLWLRHQAIDDDMIDWCKMILQHVIHKRVADGISIPAALKLYSPDAEIAKNQFQDFILHMGVLFSQATTQLLYDALLSTGDRTLQTAKLLKELQITKVSYHTNDIYLQW